MLCSSSATSYPSLPASMMESEREKVLMSIFSQDLPVYSNDGGIDDVESRRWGIQPATVHRLPLNDEFLMTQCMIDSPYSYDDFPPGMGHVYPEEQLDNLLPSQPVPSLPRTPQVFHMDSPSSQELGSGTGSTSSPSREPITPTDHYVVDLPRVSRVAGPDEESSPRYSLGDLPYVNLDQIESVMGYQLMFNPTESHMDNPNTQPSHFIRPSTAPSVSYPPYEWSSVGHNDGTNQTGTYEQSGIGDASLYYIDPTQLSDADAPSESDDELPIDDEEPTLSSSDDDFQRAARSRKRRTFKQLTCLPGKRSRNNVPSTSSRDRPDIVPKADLLQTWVDAPVQCSECTLNFSDHNKFTRHYQSSHDRIFACIFAFAGCGSVFSTKNEWKRHTTTKHLRLLSWFCTEGECTNARSTYYEFNRKDLFKNHLERIHRPPNLPTWTPTMKGTRRARSGNKNKSSSRKGKGALKSTSFAKLQQQQEQEAWDDRVLQLQRSCEVVNRRTPEYMICPAQNCDADFTGEGAWDERMEHIAKHLRAMHEGDTPTERDCGLDFQYDRWLIQWFAKEHIIEPRTNGGWRCRIEMDNRERTGGNAYVGRGRVDEGRELKVDIDIDINDRGERVQDGGL